MAGIPISHCAESTQLVVPMPGKERNFLLNGWQIQMPPNDVMDPF